MIKGIVKGRTLTVRKDDHITTGSVGMSISFSFDEEWTDVNRSAVFIGSGKKIVVPIQNGSAIIPAEVLANKGTELYIGLYGCDNEGNKVIPTIWFGPLPIDEGTETSGAIGPNNTPWGTSGNSIIFYGVTFTPHISSDGILSWTNDGGLNNPDPVSIIGPEGPEGPAGIGVPSGGTVNQVLKKASNDDYAFTWGDASTGSGVHIGDEAPTDPNIDVWIDPTDDSWADLRSLILDVAHPVGSYYWSSESTNPATLFGGTWTQIKDKFILAAGDIYTSGDTGGEAEHTLTKAELPAERLRLQYADGRVASWGASFGSGSTGGVIINSGNGMFTENMGSGQAHNNMPPYEVAYCWKRTA